MICPFKIVAEAFLNLTDMTVTVLAILETDFIPDASLGKIMNEKLKKEAAALQDVHLKELHTLGQHSDDLVIYMSYNPKYKIRWRVVNDVPAEVEGFVSKICGNLGYIVWKTAAINLFKGVHKS